MNWLMRLFKRRTHEERILELDAEIRAERQRKASGVNSSIDQALASNTLTIDEAAALARSGVQIVFGHCSVIFETTDIATAVRELWLPPDLKEDSYLDSRPIWGLQQVAKKRDWSLALTDEFIKSTCDIDRKLQGRIFEALHQIASSPTLPRGDTVKALTGDLAGLWRYRLGDFRLIYKPDEPTMRIYLLSFGGRGAVYH